MKMNDAGGYGRFEGKGLQDVAEYRLSEVYSAFYTTYLLGLKYKIQSEIV